MSIVSHAIIVGYFTDLANNLIALNDFFRMDLTEIQGAFRSKADLPCLVLESHEGDFSDSNVQSSVNARTFAFTVYDKPGKGDYDDQNTKLNSAEEIGLKIIARMKHDSSLPDHFLYNRFKVEDINYSKVGPVFNERLYGYRFVGEIKGNEPLRVDPADWLDGPSIC
ncbi:MAG: hypothetical protein WBG90_18415 [Saonia sp.]